MKKVVEYYRPATKAELKKNPLATNVIDRIEEIEVPDEKPEDIVTIELTRSEAEKLKALLK